MPSELSKNIVKIIIALLKHQAENLLGKDAIGIAGTMLVDIEGEKIEGRIDSILNTSEGNQKLIDAALRADSYFKENCKQKDLRDVFSIPMGDLPSVQGMLKEIPNALDQSSALSSLRRSLELTFTNLKSEQIDYCANLYLECLNRALLPLKDYTLPIIGQTVLDSKSDIRDIKFKVEEILSTLTPAKASTKIRLFICYKRAAVADRVFAEYLYSYFASSGYEIFIDTTMRVGDEWLATIDEQIRSSDFLIVLVSKDSAESEMVRTEMKRAYMYRQQNGRPKTLPIRMKYEDMLPYAIDFYLGQIQYIEWSGEHDNEMVASEIAQVVNGQVDQSSLRQPATRRTTFFSEDGRAIQSATDLSKPLPEFDPRILDELEEPGGSLKLSDKFYIQREADQRLKLNILKSGTTITIRASRQTGKSSMLVRGIREARASANVVYLDLQGVEHEMFETADQFLKYFAIAIASKLHLDTKIVDKIWHDKLGPQDKLVKVMEECILPGSERQVVLAIDEADRLLAVPYHSDFFALLRSWHNNRAVDPMWNKLNLAMVIATEPYLLISNPNQSPFNVGTKLNLEDFNRAQVGELNRRHGAPIHDDHMEIFFELLNGHPYLTRKALYLLIAEDWSWENLYKEAASDHGPFADNLRRQLWFIQEDTELQAALRQVLYHGKCDNDRVLWRLLRAGLVKGMGERYYLRCGLYEKYFREHLR